MRPTQIKQELTHDALTISQIMPVQDSSSSKLVQRLRLSYQLQDQVQSLLLEKCQYNGSLLSLLSIGNKVLSQQINKISQQHPIDYTVVQSRSKSRASLEGLLCIFKSKEYLNRHLLNLERTFEVQRQAALQFQQKIHFQEQDIFRFTDKLQQLQQENIQSYTNCESQVGHIQ